MVITDKQAREALTPTLDFDFALAHLVLEHKDYAEHYAESAKRGRIVLLDNSMHENGHSLSVVELAEACKRIEPSFVIAPDRIGDMKFTYEGFKALRDELPRRFLRTKLAICIQGESHEQRCALFEATAKHASMICFPFREPRLHWFEQLASSIPQYVRWPPYLHLLGISSLEELVRWNSRLDALQWPRHRTSVDSNKPLRFAYNGTRMSETLELRGATWPKEMAWLPDVERTALFNIAFTRRFL